MADIPRVVTRLHLAKGTLADAVALYKFAGALAGLLPALTAVAGKDDDDSLLAACCQELDATVGGLQKLVELVEETVDLHTVVR